jgi:LysM repeat protein
MKKARMIVLLLGLCLLPLLVATTNSTQPVAAQTTQVVPYVVQEGDSLSKIARKYCTSWQEIYEMNKGVIGSDPNVVEPGTLIYVVPRCGSGGDGIYDRGPRLHANGTVNGNVYTVAWGDTLYSISQRFGVAMDEVIRVNGTDKVYAGQKLVIPGLQPPTQPPTVPQSQVFIVSPASGSYLTSSFIVSGTGVNLPEGNVVVRVRDGNGNIMAELPTVLKGQDAGIGGQGTWAVTFTGVNGQPYSNGTIEAFSPGTSAYQAISIWFTGQQ